MNSSVSNIMPITSDHHNMKIESRRDELNMESNENLTSESNIVEPYMPMETNITNRNQISEEGQVDNSSFQPCRENVQEMNSRNAQNSRPIKVKPRYRVKSGTDRSVQKKVKEPELSLRDGDEEVKHGVHNLESNHLDTASDQLQRQAEGKENKAVRKEMLCNIWISDNVDQIELQKAYQNDSAENSSNSEVQSDRDAQDSNLHVEAYDSDHFFLTNVKAKSKCNSHDAARVQFLKQFEGNESKTTTENLSYHSGIGDKVEQSVRAIQLKENYSHSTENKNIWECFSQSKSHDNDTVFSTNLKAKLKYNNHNTTRDHFLKQTEGKENKTTTENLSYNSGIGENVEQQDQVRAIQLKENYNSSTENKNIWECISQSKSDDSDTVFSTDFKAKLKWNKNDATRDQFQKPNRDKDSMTMTDNLSCNSGIGDIFEQQDHVRTMQLRGHYINDFPEKKSTQKVQSNANIRASTLHIMSQDSDRVLYSNFKARIKWNKNDAARDQFQKETKEEDSKTSENLSLGSYIGDNVGQHHQVRKIQFNKQHQNNVEVKRGDAGVRSSNDDMLDNILHSKSNDCGPLHSTKFNSRYLRHANEYEISQSKLMESSSRSSSLIENKPRNLYASETRTSSNKQHSAYLRNISGDTSAKNTVIKLTSNKQHSAYLRNISEDTSTKNAVTSRSFVMKQSSREKLKQKQSSSYSLIEHPHNKHEPLLELRCALNEQTTSSSFYGNNFDKQTQNLVTEPTIRKFIPKISSSNYEFSKSPSRGPPIEHHHFPHYKNEPLKDLRSSNNIDARPPITMRASNLSSPEKSSFHFPILSRFSKEKQCHHKDEGNNNKSHPKYFFLNEDPSIEVSPGASEETLSLSSSSSSIRHNCWKSESFQHQEQHINQKIQMRKLSCFTPTKLLKYNKVMRQPLEDENQIQDVNESSFRAGNQKLQEKKKMLDFSPILHHNSKEMIIEHQQQSLDEQIPLLVNYSLSSNS